MTAPNEDIEAFLRALHNGGRIVSTGDLDEREIVKARATGRMLVLDDGIGFVRFSSPDALQGYADDCRASEAEAREAEWRAKARAEKAEALVRELAHNQCEHPSRAEVGDCFHWCLPCRARAHLKEQK